MRSDELEGRSWNFRTLEVLTEFKAVKIEQVGRDLNSNADALAGLPSVFEGEIGQTIAVDLISAPSYKKHQEFVLVNIELGSS